VLEAEAIQLRDDDRIEPPPLRVLQQGVEVGDVLEPGGLIASDGSLAILQLAAFKGHPRGEEAFDAAKPFTRFGRTFCCVGYLDERYGPTLVWKVT